MTTTVEELLNQAKSIIIENRDKRKRAEDLQVRILQLKQDYEEDFKKLDKYLKGATILGNVSDNSIKNTLTTIEGVINKALAVIFPIDPREIKIEPVMFNDAYPHFKVTLFTGVNKEITAFKFSGSGLQQIVSFLFTISFIDVSKGRPIIVMDELLNGLHPSAKKLIRDMVKAVSNRFQFIIVEYGMDLPKEYKVERVGSYSTIEPYKGLYYKDLNIEMLEDM